MYSCNSKITLIVAAAGVGKRMGLNYPKQFFEIDNKPLFLLTLEKAEKIEAIKDIIIVTRDEDFHFVKKNIKEIKKVKVLVKGGKERQNSIENALKYCENTEFIAVQDAVRPFMKSKYFSQALEMLENDKSLAGVVVATRLKDTIKKVDIRNEIIETPNRDEFVAVQTPQIFRENILKKAYKKAKEDEFLGTDDSSLVERYGGKVKILIGDYDNVKITTKEDLIFLENKE